MSHLSLCVVLLVASNAARHYPLTTSHYLGGDNRDRTDDPLLAKQVLSQLSYTPISLSGSDPEN